MVPIVQAIIGSNEKLSFKTSTTSTDIQKKGKRKGKRIHVLAESNFIKIAGSLLLYLRPQTKTYKCGPDGKLESPFTGRDLNWIAANVAKQKGEPITEKQQKLIAPWLFDKKGNPVPQREKQTIGRLLPE